MLDKITSSESGHDALRPSFDEEARKRKAAECKAQRLDERLRYANASLFVDKRQKVKKGSGKVDVSGQIVLTDEGFSHVLLLGITQWQ